MQPKIAILITTFERPELLRKAVESILDNWCDNFVILIGDQSRFDDGLMQNWSTEMPEYLHYFKLPFNCGLSYSRNFLARAAQRLGCEYSILSADSICFDESMKKINDVLCFFNNTEKLGRIGLKLKGRINWEGWLTLVPGKYFELDLIDTTAQGVYNCDCIKNLFIARTESLITVHWDEALKMCEHEDWQYRYNKEWRTLYTNDFTCTYQGVREGKFADYRQINWNEGMKYLLNKYSIKQWINYKNSELFKKD